MPLTPAELTAWCHRADPDRDPVDAIADPVWRLANLYRCLTQDGADVPFIPTPEQQQVIWCLYVRGWQRLIIPKARQLGMSLLLCLCALDGMVFRTGFRGALIDKKEDDAAKKLREKVKFAWERLRADLRADLTVIRQNSEELALRDHGAENAAESSYQAEVSFRGGTVEWLHISEWGAIQDTDRQRSREIKAGALPAVERAADGICVIETTWKGGLDGELGPLVQEALAIPEEEKGPRSWRVLFFGWHTCPLYRQSHGYIDDGSAKYFAEVEAMGITLTQEQKLWYAEKRRTATNAKTVKEEYPTLMHECWENLPQGSIYGKWLEEAKVSGRVHDYHADKRWPVHTFWDLGHPVNTVTWLAQVTPQEIRVLDVIMELDITLEERAAMLRAKGWDYGCHFLPWDANENNSAGLRQVDEFRRVLGHSVRVVPRTTSVWHGISMVRGLFPRFVFHRERCRTGLEHLARYRAERETSTGIARDIPLHDRYSHAADAFRQLGQAIDAHLVEHGNAVGAAVSSGEHVKVVRAGRWM